jgi:hypothetical protein
MNHVISTGRLAGLAVGLGIGAALAASPGVAWADDFQINIDGMNLFPVEGNTATATAGMGDIAIAFGAGANASATGGSGDYAMADGAGTIADSGNGNFDSASAFGEGTKAAAGYGNGDSATAIDTGSGGGALAGGGSLLDENDDSSFSWGLNSIASAGDSFGNYPSSNDIAAVFDPFGTVGSTAYATGGNFDLAAAFGDMQNAMTAIGNYLIDIMPSL